LEHRDKVRLQRGRKRKVKEDFRSHESRVDTHENGRHHPSMAGETAVARVGEGVIHGAGSGLSISPTCLTKPPKDIILLTVELYSLNRQALCSVTASH
jgi:hypothetical protein